MSADLDADKLAAQFKVSREFVMRQCRAQRWPFYRIGRNYWFTPEHVEQIKRLNESGVRVAQDGEGWGVKGRAS